MEALWIATAPRLIEIGAVVLIGLASWGIAWLRKKTKLDVGKAALDEVNRVVKTVVGNLSQTAVKNLKIASADGHLSSDEKAQLKRQAIADVERLVSTEVAKSANKIVDDFGSYVSKQIEAEILAGKEAQSS